MRKGLEGRSVAVLAADAVGYSHAVGIDEALALRALGNSRRIIDAVIEKHGGRIFNTAGDSVLAEFLAPAEAVRCALAMQEALRGAASENPLLTFRIGISPGDVIVDGTNLLGATVNVAARLEAIAPAGGVCISGAVHDAIADEHDMTGRISAPPSQEPGQACPCLSLRSGRRQRSSGGGRSPKATSNCASLRQLERGWPRTLSQRRDHRRHHRWPVPLRPARRAWHDVVQRLSGSLGGPGPARQRSSGSTTSYKAASAVPATSSGCRRNWPTRDPV